MSAITRTNCICLWITVRWLPRGPAPCRGSTVTP
nr:MAG TPA: hypothetical protein [Caudoviricetes sp.]